MTLHCKDKVLSHVKQFFIDLQKFKLQVWSKLPVKIERSEYFAVNHDMQKWTFWKLSTERSLPQKKLTI